MKGDILYELYTDTCSDVSDDSDNNIFDSHSDIPTISSRKQLQPSTIVVTSDSETSTEEEESSELDRSDDKTSDMWCKNDKKPSHEPFLGTTGLKIVTESIVEVMNSITGDDIVQLLTKQANLYHSQNAQTWTVLPKTLK